uniref:SH3 domain-containing protein n=1 Tax=Sexangularia sp. CB-2014 TaxID=1486929 RepID=A0A7S1VDK9_9EUKA|mmetsp:Transcript_16814/g.52575  ORF Transcript_16814/g.52575 Transcript_16814/m.52575 type:complete len:109 (+) Transcript_16814:3-329(+)
MGPAPASLLAPPAGSSSRGSITGKVSPRTSITGGRPQPVPPAKKKAIAAPPAVTAVALWDFAGTESDEVPVRKGEVVTVIDESDPDWWMVRNQAGKQGTAPSNYLKKQ